ncbi:MAG: hypothetical protein JNN02_04240 [Tabrizicola sp.]|nr:hypothetical protein [Tabrizicola sp.]
MQAESGDEEMTGIWKFVAKGNEKAWMKAMAGDPAGALADLDTVRDQAMQMDEADAEWQNEIECRRLESRLMVADFARDHELLWHVMREIGDSNRFSAERLHENMSLASSLVRDALRRLKP